MAVVKRLKKEWELLEKEKDSTKYKVEMLNDDIMKWEWTLYPPTNTPFGGGVYKVTTTMESTYPFKPPKVHWCNKIYCCSINDKGDISFGIARDQWSPALTVQTLMERMYDFVFTNGGDLESSLVGDIGNLYIFVVFFLFFFDVRFCGDKKNIQKFHNTHTKI